MRIPIFLAIPLVLVSSPRSPFAAMLRIEAEEARVQTVGRAENGIWNLWSNGELGDYLRFEKTGRYAVAVWAYGSPAKGVWPQMALAVDDEIADKAFVETGATKEYAFSAEVERGLHKIALVFLNNARWDGEDRNLYLDAIEIRPEGDMPVPTLGNEEEWERDWRMRTAAAEEQTLEEARTAIEGNRKTDAAIEVVDETGRPVPDASVTVSQTAHDFLFGCNSFGFDRFDTNEKNELYKQRFLGLFNYATTGFYWRWYESEPGKPRYEETDKVVAWCASHGIRVKGHPLLWDHEAGEPQWAGGQPSPELQEKRVREIVGRYKGKIAFWEVVNEPSHVQGVDIAAPYRWAREADPEAHLIVNDYEAMANGYPPFFDLLEKAIRNGVPFDGIGIQAHEPRTMRFPLHRVKAVLDQYAALGKDLHVTEFTPTSSGVPITGSHIQGGWDEAAQADYAVKFYTVCFAHPAVVAITWWDLCQAGAWLEGGGLLREDLSPKPAYLALKKLIHEDWRTSVGGKTDRDGRFTFRGFHGTYAATIESSGKKVERTFLLQRGRAPTVRVVLE